MPHTLIQHQVKPSDELLDFIIDPSRSGVLVVGQTGCGKTYVLANALRRAQQEHGLLLAPKDNPLKIYSIFMLVPKKAIIQQKRVLFKEGVKDCEVISHSALSSSYGALFIDYIKEENRGAFIDVPVWTEESKPDLIVIDESQFVKNGAARRTQIIHAAIRQGIKVILISATPFQKACEAEVTILACGIVKNHKSFTYYANDISPGGPEKNSPIAIRRIKQDLIKHNSLIRITGAKYPFKPKIQSAYLTLSPEKRIIYDKTWEDYLEVCRKEGRNGPDGIRKIWVQNNKLRESSEILKADQIAARSFQVQTFIEQPRQCIIGANFVATLEKAWSCLVKIHGVNPKDISVLYGGQTDKQAQDNIDRFNEGYSKYFLTTMKSGGTSISLHHEIQNPLALPRYVILGLSWSVYEMIQLLGRAQRITSASQTIQEICAFKDTIEEYVESRLEEKFECLRELIERKDSFIHDIFNKNVKGYIDADEYEKISKEEEANDNDDKEDEATPDLGMFGDTKEFGEE